MASSFKSTAPPAHPRARGPARTDLTATFRVIVQEQAGPSSPRPQPHQPPSKSQAAAAWKRRREAEVQWNGEATKLHRDIQSLHGLLSAVRRPYLHLGPPPRQFDGMTQPRSFGEEPQQQSQKTQQADPTLASTAATEQGLHGYAQLPHLTEEQKDEVDLHLKLVLEKSIQRLKELIKAEDMRKASQPTPAASAFARLLAPVNPSNSLDSTEYSEQLNSHREAITAQMGASLKRAGERAGLMQEARVRALEERAGKRRIGGPDVSKAEQASSSRVRSEKSAAQAVPGSVASFRATALPHGADGEKSSPAQGQGAGAAEEELTQEQMQLFASESSALAKTLQADLAAVESVQRTLHTIAELQTTLVQHLSMQNETIASLGNEAVDQRVEVEKGNTQLKKARERNRSANRLLGALLVGSGLGLLFLHVMD